MTFRIVLEYDAEVEAFSVFCPELPGCASAGNTEEEARRNIKEAIELCLEPSEIDLPTTAKLAEVTVG
jgi:predicted RNase H-like HicB family nuclease